MNIAGESLKIVAGNVPVSTGTSVDGTGVSRAGYDHITIACQTGAASGTPTSYSATFKLQESDSLSTGYTDVTTTQNNGNAVSAAITADNTVAKILIDARGLKKYVRVNVTAAMTGGSTPKALVASTMIFAGGVVPMPIS